jgi:hypothetical protein
VLRSASHLKNYTLSATDGELGKVKDFLFDDQLWVIRYLVVDCGRWLPGRRVLLIPSVLGEADWSQNVLPVTLTKEQIEKSPGIGEDRPVSRQREEELHAHYGWSPYWAGAEAAYFAARAAEIEQESEPPERKGDPNLRSVAEVTGYHIAAVDGEIGHVEDFIVEDRTWWIRYVVVDTRNWLPGKKVLAAPQWMRRISWSDRTASVDLTREQLKNCPEYDPSAPVNREYEARLYDYYGRPRYWE